MVSTFLFAICKDAENKLSQIKSEKALKLMLCCSWVVGITTFHFLGIYDDLMAATTITVSFIIAFCTFFSPKNFDGFFWSTIFFVGIFMPLWFMFHSSKYFAFCQLCAVFYGTMVAAFTPRVPTVTILSLWGVFPWVIIIKLYNFDEADPLALYIRRDSGYSVAMYLFVLMLVFWISGQRDRALIGLREVIAELEQKNKTINEINAQLQQSLEDKDNFILLLSHETRNPLNILMGNLSLLIQDAKNCFPQFLDKLNKCKFCSELLLQYINNILDCGKLNNHGKLDITTSSTNLKEFLLKNWRLMETMITKKGLQARLTIVSELPEYVKIDSQRVTQILLNIIGNASKFTDKGNVSLHVSYLSKKRIQEKVDFLPENLQTMTLLEDSEIHTDDFRPEKRTVSHDLFEEAIQPYHQVFEKELSRAVSLRNILPSHRFSASQEKQGFLKFEVVDTGCGIDKDQLNKLFKKFSQLGNDLQKRAIGTGLGLWISRSLCQAMGGDIKVYSKPGKGTCFSIIVDAPTTIPKNEGHSASYQKANQHHLQGMPLLTTLPNIAGSEDNRNREMLKKINNAPPSVIRILLADDEPDNLDLHKKILKQLGYEVIDIVMNGIQLVEAYITKPSNYYSCIISDIAMPLMNGNKAIKKIREFEKANNWPPVAVGFITGHANAKNLEECTLEPISAKFLHSKPINPELLHSLLNGIGVFPNKNRQQANKKMIEMEPYKERNIVLCVDDDLYNLQVLKAMLEKHNVKTLLCSRGVEAIQAFKEKHKQIRCIVLDCNMPEKDGWETSLEIKSFISQNYLEDVPIYGVTGDNLMRVKERFTRSGMTALLTKPIDFQTVSCIVNGI